LEREPKTTEKGEEQMAKGNLSEEVAKRVVEELVEEFKQEAREHVRSMIFKGIATYRPQKAGKSVATHEIKVMKRQIRRPVEANYDEQTYDQKKFKLGDLCEAGHEFQGTGKALRYQISGRCALCQSVYNKHRRQKTTLVEQTKNGELPTNEHKKLEKLLGINRKMHTLGEICAYKHNHEKTGYSLRYISTGRCVECNREYGREHWKKKKKAEKKKAKKKSKK
jgi:hypothetical protein